MIHRLKTWPIFYERLLDGSKTFEFRFNDRDYRVNDNLVLKEWDVRSEKYTGRYIHRTITYIMNHFDARLVVDKYPPSKPIAEGWVILGIVDPAEVSTQREPVPRS